jgi:hypothetical protein
VGPRHQEGFPFLGLLRAARRWPLDFVVRSICSLQLPRQQTPWFPLLLCFGSDSARDYKNMSAAPPQRTALREEIKREQGRDKEIPAVTMEPRRRLQLERVMVGLGSLIDGGELELSVVVVLPWPPLPRSGEAHRRALASVRETVVTGVADFGSRQNGVAGRWRWWATWWCSSTPTRSPS